MLFGTLLFAVPLIIHLLNRQRYKRRRWAAMEYLLIAFKKQRRRLRVENLLLLLLRCLIPLILALAIARPVLREGGPLAGLGTSAHYFVILDASYSMGYQPEGGLSPFSSSISRKTARPRSSTSWVQISGLTCVTGGTAMPASRCNGEAESKNTGKVGLSWQVNCRNGGQHAECKRVRF